MNEKVKIVLKDTYSISIYLSCYLGRYFFVRFLKVILLLTME